MDDLKIGDLVLFKDGTQGIFTGYEGEGFLEFSVIKYFEDCDKITIKNFYNTFKVKELHDTRNS